jgi:hypothetical protein
MYLQYVVHLVYLCLLHSHHVFFDFELVDPVHTDPWRQLHLWMQAGHPAPCLLRYERMFDQYVEGRC